MTDLSVNPNGIAITPDGSRAYVTSFTNVNPVIIIIDIAAKKSSAVCDDRLRSGSFAPHPMARSSGSPLR